MGGSSALWASIVKHNWRELKDKQEAGKAGRGSLANLGSELC